MLLDGKVAIVTGSGAGMGRCFARALASAGAKVLVNARTASNVAKVVEEIRQAGGTAQGVVATVATMDGARQIVDTAVKTFGKVDILVNNAGVVLRRPFLEMEEKDFDEVIGTDLKGVFACARYAAPYMVKQKWGRIINVASGAARGRRNLCTYSAAKGGVLAMSAALAQELGPYGITVNAFRAAAATTDSPQLLQAARQAAKDRGEEPPETARDLGFFDPEMVAPTVVFLSSDEASGITGQFVAVDGPRLSLWCHPGPAISAVMPGGWTIDALLDHFKTTVGLQLQTFGFRGADGKRTV